MAFTAPVTSYTHTHRSLTSYSISKSQSFGLHFQPIRINHVSLHKFTSKHHLCTISTRAQNENRPLNQLEIEVPPDQRPVNELAQLKSSPLFSWAMLDLTDYTKRLIILWGTIFTFISGPIAFQTFDPTRHPIEFFLSASAGSLLVVAIASLRIYLGWKYVADRLMTATLEYEETGWYDGQIFVKPPEILTRDRLLGTYEARPVLSRLRTTLQGTGIALLVTAVILAGVVNGPGSNGNTRYGDGPVTVTPDGILFSNKVKSLDELITDDEAAEAEAEAQGGVPGYCRDRYYKALSGQESICEKFR